MQLNSLIEMSNCEGELILSGGGQVCAEEDLPAIELELPYNGTWTVTYSNGAHVETFAVTGSAHTFVTTIEGNYTVTASEGTCTFGPSNIASVGHMHALGSANTFTLCLGESVTVGDNVYEETGEYEDILTSVMTGCDSVVVTNLTILPVFESQNPQTICSGASYQLQDSVYTISGTYLNIYKALSNGCDSLVYTILTVLDPIVADNPQTICFGQSYEIGDSVYDQEGTYIDILTSVLYGCDSTVTTVLTIREELIGSETVVLCYGESYTIGSSTYSLTGNYVVATYSVIDGCDSTVHLNLTIKGQNLRQNPQTICAGQSYTFLDSTFTTAGTHDYILQSLIDGCDSIIRTVLTVTDFNISVAQTSGTFIVQPIPGATFEWIDCDTEEVVATTLNFIATANGSYRLHVMRGDCEEETICYTVHDLSTNAVDQMDVTVYPNPTNGIINISAGDNNIEEIAIYENNGRLIEVVKGNSNNQMLSIEHLSNGMYFLQIKAQGNTVTKKITKQF